VHPLSGVAIVAECTYPSDQGGGRGQKLFTFFDYRAFWKRWCLPPTRVHICPAPKGDTCTLAGRSLRTQHVASPHIHGRVPMASQACEWSAAASTQRMRWAARRSQQTRSKSLYRTLHAPSRHKQQELRSLKPLCGACCPRLVLSAPPPLVPAMYAASARSRRGGVVVRVAPFVLEAFDRCVQSHLLSPTFRRR